MITNIFQGKKEQSKPEQKTEDTQTNQKSQQSQAPSNFYFDKEKKRWVINGKIEDEEEDS
jgi:hypothetical protein